MEGRTRGLALISAFHPSSVLTFSLHFGQAVEEGIKPHTPKPKQLKKEPIKQGHQQHGQFSSIRLPVPKINHFVPGQVSTYAKEEGKKKGKRNLVLFG